MRGRRGSRGGASVNRTDEKYGYKQGDREDTRFNQNVNYLTSWANESSIWTGAAMHSHGSRT